MSIRKRWSFCGYDKVSLIVLLTKRDIMVWPTQDNSYVISLFSSIVLMMVRFLKIMAKISSDRRGLLGTK